MRVLGDADGFGELPDCMIGIMRGPTDRPDLVEALARHISESLDNITVPEAVAAIDLPAISAIGLGRGRHGKPALVSPGW